MLLLKDLPKYDTLIENLDACLARHDLLQGRWWVLILLMREQNLTASPSVLADKAGVTRATMTGLLDSLERAELIERIPNPDDRRMLNVRLTEKGQQRLDEVMPDYYSRVARVMEELSEDHRQLLMEMLSNVGSRVDLLGAA